MKLTGGKICWPSRRETMFCQPSAMTRDRVSRVLFAFLDNHCQARINQFVTRELRSAARSPPCCLTNWMNENTMIKTSSPHKRMDRASVQAGLMVAGGADSAGGSTGRGGGVVGSKSGGG